MARCNNCGERLFPTDTFCGFCGATVEGTTGQGPRPLVGEGSISISEREALETKRRELAKKKAEARRYEQEKKFALERQKEREARAAERKKNELEAKKAAEATVKVVNEAPAAAKPAAPVVSAPKSTFEKVAEAIAKDEIAAEASTAPEVNLADESFLDDLILEETPKKFESLTSVKSSAAPAEETYEEEVAETASETIEEEVAEEEALEDESFEEIEEELPVEEPFEEAEEPEEPYEEFEEAAEPEEEALEAKPETAKKEADEEVLKGETMFRLSEELRMAIAEADRLEAESKRAEIEAKYAEEEAVKAKARAARLNNEVPESEKFVPKKVTKTSAVNYQAGADRRAREEQREYDRVIRKKKLDEKNVVKAKDILVLVVGVAILVALMFFLLLYEPNKKGNDSYRKDVPTPTEAVGTAPSEEIDIKVGEAWTGSIAESFAVGAGTEANPYLIHNGEELAFLASQVNSGVNYAGCFFA